jgi:ubiquitin carboxyl-terminal hydrolase 8
MISEIQQIQTDTDETFVSGIKNIGNTCYLNSCFQLLLYTYELLDVIHNNETLEKKNIPETMVLLEWVEIKNILLHKKCTVTPLKCIAGIHRVAKLKEANLFVDGEQNDICEFLLFILDCFHVSLSRKITMEYQDYLNYMKIPHSVISEKCFQLIRNQCLTDYSEILNLFYGIQLNVIQSIDGLRIISLNPSTFSIISLNIPDNILQPTLHNCIDLYCESELLENDNAYYDDNEKTYISVLKGVIFWRLPHILIFTFNRLKPNKRGKNNTLIHFPIQNLDMTNYVYQDDPKNLIQINYELYGIGCHFGIISTGHYTCYVKNKNKWYFCNDDTIKQVNNPIHLINPNVYCLFYRKINFS